MAVFWEWLWPTLTAAGFALIGFFGHALFVRVRDAAANRAAGDILRDVPFTDGVGIMPLQIPKYFFELKLCEREELPLLPKDGAEFFRRKGLVLEQSRYKWLIEGEGQTRP